jgi:hypothetical protein
MSVGLLLFDQKTLALEHIVTLVQQILDTNAGKQLSLAATDV